MQNIKFISADEAVKVVKSGDHIHLSSVASAPQVLIQALCRRGEAGELKDVRIHHLHTEGAAPYTDPRIIRALTNIKPETNSGSINTFFT